MHKGYKADFENWENWHEKMPWHGNPMFRGWHGMQAKRGDISPLLLGVLLERPMHGYEIIRELEKRSHGMWRPSPGSVYPTLQLLEEEELVTGKEENGKKIYTITDAGRKQAEDKKTTPPWAENEQVGKVIKLKSALFELAGLSRHILHAGSDVKLDQAAGILAKTKAELEKLLED